MIENADGAIIEKATIQMATHPTAAEAGLVKVLVLASVSRLNRDFRIPTDLVTAMAAIVR